MGKWLAVLAASILCVGCVSMVETAGRILDGSAFAERIYAAYDGEGLEVREVLSRENRRDDFTRSLVILPERFPSVLIRATRPDADGAFLLVSLDYLGGNEHGWNEFTLDLFGSGVFAADGSDAGFSLSPGFEPVQISRARIRRFDTRITGNDALTYLRNRHERILALTEWMRDFYHPQGAGAERPCHAEFGRRWKPILFPEAVRAGHRPAGWLREGDVRIRAENVGWNIDYSRRVFPELLWNVRDSGTLLRDWEEALEWIHLKYEWDYLAELLSRETALTRSR